MLFLKYGYLQLRKQLTCACSKVKSSAYFSMGPTHGHWQNLWRKSSMARIHVMLRKVQNMSWKDKVSNNFPYGSNPRVTEIITRKRLSLAGQVSRHNEPAGRVLWEPDKRRRVGHPKITLKKILEDDTGLEARELQTVMLDRVSWRKNFVKSPIFSDAVK